MSKSSFADDWELHKDDLTLWRFSECYFPLSVGSDLGKIRTFRALWT